MSAIYWYSQKVCQLCNYSNCSRLRFSYPIAAELARALLKVDTEDQASLLIAQPGELGVAEPGSLPPSPVTREASPAASETNRPDIGRLRPVAACSVVTGPARKGNGTPMTYTFKLSRRMAANDPGRLLLAPLLLLLAACGANTATGPDTGTTPPPQAPTPGWLTVQLTDPNIDDGALQLRVTGPALDTIAGDARYDGFGAVTNGVADLVVTGKIVSGNLARFRVADVNQASQYQVSLVAVVQEESYALRSTSGYRAVIVR